MPQAKAKTTGRTAKRSHSKALPGKTVRRRGTAVPGPKPKYHPSFCQNLIEHRRAGNPFVTLGAVVGCGKTTLYEWVKQYPEFRHAHEVGTSLAMQWWVRQGMEGLFEGTETSGTGAERVTNRKRLNYPLWRFMMFNLFAWRPESDTYATPADEIPEPKPDPFAIFSKADEANPEQPQGRGYWDGWEDGFEEGKEDALAAGDSELPDEEEEEEPPAVGSPRAASPKPKPGKSSVEKAAAPKRTPKPERPKDHANPGPGSKPEYSPGRNMPAPQAPPKPPVNPMRTDGSLIRYDEHGEVVWPPNQRRFQQM
jgi:hypothetical protein